MVVAAKGLEDAPGDGGVDAGATIWSAYLERLEESQQGAHELVEPVGSMA
jgi:hypothetical protein